MSPESFRRAVVLVSGGMDSAVTLAIACAQGFTCHALSVAYGQRHASELAAAESAWFCGSVMVRAFVGSAGINL